MIQNAHRMNLPNTPDEHEFLRFSCVRGCTRCCEQKGWVYLTEEDLAGAARFLQMTPEAFERQYIYRTRHRARLRKPPRSQCHFLREGGCSIHPAKPTQCRLFPFWPELVEDRAEWLRAGESCPGINQGPLIHIGNAMEAASEMKTAYPLVYDD
ncbi:MAG TPA: YkgJ family cysteine cluster protein [Bryobacteraceae bacterium]|nr:YkgJ family cysteine cluster protein [Bryobacteraceae bacterium]